MNTPAKPRRQRLNRGEQKEIRSQELLDAAWELFCERGYEAVTIDQVAELAGYSRKPVYTLFGDKQTLFFELWSRMFIGMADLTVSLFDPRQTLRTNLKRVAELGAERGSQERSRKVEGLLFFVIQTITLSRPDLEKRVQPLFEDAQSRLAQAIRSCPLDRKERLRGSAEQVAAHLAAHINGLSLLQFQTGRNYMQAQDLYDLFVYMAIVREE
ncbi:TetR/AcrR family transcriptional regulator [Solimonas sp. SE-A11]|uniref:TetR/AcrR family transcriptional regulator n=1 Tax=Solimonas sp. SE-A11 TaxID=3054954 RepID=UPI00259D06D4|nr:TetR/AcrR family transcriptional regulator [Solimonas sp. SE-A11]MDM4769831.1 helix-turn-helix domain-containing protein [Solimonas sp. SE-A11]